MNAQRATASPVLIERETPTRLSVPIGALHEHPAQMRTVYNLDEMATLTLQVFENDLDGWQAIVATPIPEQDGYYIISGHRRRMARLFAYAIDTWRKHPDSGIDPETPLDLETVRGFIATLVEKYDYVDAAADALAAKFAERTVEVALFHGSVKAQILALQRANYGAETPDAMGVAHSVHAALEAGATIEEVARNAGQSIQYVKNHLALTQVPVELAERIADGKLPMSVGLAVADLAHEAKRAGLALFILSNPPERITAKGVKECAARLKAWNGLQPPLSASSQNQFNIARVLCHLWQQSVDAYPTQVWAIVASFIYQGTSCEAPWEQDSSTRAWLQALGGERYVGSEGVIWKTVVQELLPEVSCETCPLAKLPARQLRADLPHLPCRTGRSVTRCLSGFTPSDAFTLPAPWSWSEHPGVTKRGSLYTMESFEALQQAWNAQAAAEDAEDAAAEEAEEPQPRTDEITAAPTASQTSAPPAPAKKVDKGPSPVQRMRSQIADYMTRHLRMDAEHPFATPCHRCQHQLMKSPTKDDTVPHCAWAGRLRQVEFKMLRPDDGQQADLIPVCRQFAPRESWADIIPEHPAPAEMPRDWVKAYILEHYQAGQRVTTDIQPFEFLTGRPLGANENHKDWFKTMLEEQIGNLSDGQLWTLFIWAMAEWQRRRVERSWDTPTFLPRNGTGTQFISVREVAWPSDAGEGQHA